MTYDEWEASVPDEITGDILWRMALYRQALFLGELAWFDATKLMSDRRTLEISDQLFRSVGRISAHIAEGYSKASGKDQARFYEYALGSAREGRDWYYKGRRVLTEEVALHRMRLSTHIIRQLLRMIPHSRRNAQLREDIVAYDVHPLEELLAVVPMP